MKGRPDSKKCIAKKTKQKKTAREKFSKKFMLILCKRKASERISLIL